MNKILNQHNLYWAYPIDTSLQEEIRHLAVSFHNGQIGQSELSMARNRFVRALNRSIDAGFEFYYQTPTEQEGNLSPLVKRTVDSIVNTVRSAIHLVVQQLFKSMPLQELTLMSYYLDSMIIPNPEKKARLAFPLNENIRHALTTIAKTIEQTESIDDYSEPLAALFSNIVRESTRYYYQIPTEFLTINRFAKKAADLSIDGAAKGIIKIIRRVIKDISHEKVVLLFNHLHLLMLASELQYKVGAPYFIEDKSLAK